VILFSYLDVSGARFHVASWSSEKTLSTRRFSRRSPIHLSTVVAISPLTGTSISDAPRKASTGATGIAREVGRDLFFMTFIGVFFINIGEFMKLFLSRRLFFDFGSVKLENIAWIAFENAADLFKRCKVNA